MSVDPLAGLAAAWSSARTDFNAQALRRAGEATSANRLVEASLASMVATNARPAASAPPPAPAPSASPPPPPPGQGLSVDKRA
jgi:hypothetical protein